MQEFSELLVVKQQASEDRYQGNQCLPFLISAPQIVNSFILELHRKGDSSSCIEGRFSCLIQP